MLKAMATGFKDGKPVKILMMGLSHENLRRLQSDKPILFAGDVFELPGYEFLIFTGVDEKTIMHTMADLIGPDTKHYPPTEGDDDGQG